MIDINIVHNQIIEELKASNDFDVITGLNNSALGAVTGSEALALTGKYLLDLKKNNAAVYQLIKQEIREYLKYCKPSGLIIK